MFATGKKKIVVTLYGDVNKERTNGYLLFLFLSFRLVLFPSFFLYYFFCLDKKKNRFKDPKHSEGN